MSYIKWFEEHATKHAAIMKKLEHLSDDEVIDYFVFENMVEKEPNFCKLYKDNKKCHDTDYLNCYFCACPNFRFDDKGIEKQEGKTLYSTCSIDSKDGAQFEGEDYIHQNCAGCLVPHKHSYIKKYFTRNWSEAMKKVPLNS